MRTRMLILPLLLLTAGTTTATAQSPVASWELDRFIGSSLKGYGHTPLGTVGAAVVRILARQDNALAERCGPAKPRCRR